jgi:hypothetical protein
MEKPTIISIEDGNGEVIYMRFIDAAQTQKYIDYLEEISDDFVSILTAEGEEYFSLQDYVKGLLDD